MLEDYQNAPQPRQEEILKFLISYALNKEVSDLVQQNAYSCISYLRPLTQSPVLVKIGQHLQEKAGRSIDARMARVANTAGVFPYLRQSARASFFEHIFGNMKKVGTRWTAREYHGELLRSFMEVGGLEYCTDEIRTKILKWLVLTYLGEPGGRTSYGNVRHVFYSNSAAPLVRELIKNSAQRIGGELVALKADRDINRALQNDHISRRLEALIDIVQKE